MLLFIVQALYLAVLFFFSQGALLKPHIPLLVIALLESLSGLENQVRACFSFHLRVLMLRVEDKELMTY